MFGRNAAEAPVRGRAGLTCRILLQEGDVQRRALTATWFDVAPGLRRRPHNHDAEQVYVVQEGRGKIRVGDAEREMTRVNPVYMPSRAGQGIENGPGENLVYVSTATPIMNALAAYDMGQLRAEAENEEEA